jgi:DNA segregation ATPase FtsK/SpoIIIE-like protein
LPRSGQAVNVITSSQRGKFPCRIAFRDASQIDRQPRLSTAHLPAPALLEQRLDMLFISAR